MAVSEAPRSTPSLAWSVAISSLVVLASAGGLLSRQFYAQETSDWATQARGQDLGNLLAVVFLLVSGTLYRRGSAVAGRMWRGTLLYLIYAYVVYAVAVHFNRLFLVYVAVLGLSAYAVILDPGRAATDGDAPVARAGRRVIAITLIVTGALFALLWLRDVIPAVISGVPPRSVTDAGLVANPIHVIDLGVVLPAFIATGVGVLKEARWARSWCVPWLAFSLLMGASIVFGMVLAAAGGAAGTLPAMIVVGLVTLASGVALRWGLLRPDPGVVPHPA